MLRVVSGKCWDGMSETCGIFTWQAPGWFSQKLVSISAASAGAVKSETCVDTAWVCSGMDTEMGSCIFSGSKGQRTVWDAGETMLQGGKMQRSSGSTGLFEAVSSSSSSVGVMQVEDARRVTQAALVIVDDS